jgi:hypothetical protein
MDKLVIEEVTDPSRLVYNRGNGKPPSLAISREVSRILHRNEISLDSPSVVSLFCKTCGATGRVCAICQAPDDGHDHTVASAAVPVRLWNMCPVCVVPFQDPPEEEDPPEDAPQKTLKDAVDLLYGGDEQEDPEEGMDDS